MYDNPVHAIVSLKAKKVGAAKSIPAFLSVELVGPGRGELREHAGSATVLYGVGKRTASRDDAETVLIFSWQSHVVRIKREISVLWSVVANPFEGLYPAILGMLARKLEMRG